MRALEIYNKEFNNYDGYKIYYGTLDISKEDSKKLTIGELKKYYHCAIKKWRPDSYIGDKLIANNMTMLVNGSYSIIEKILEQKNWFIKSLDYALEY